MAKATKAAPKLPRIRRLPDPTGRVDMLAIRLLEVAIAKYGDLPLRGIYGTYKPEIDRALKRHLGKVKFYFPTPDQLGGCHVR